MHLNIFAFAIPLFTGLMLMEYYISRKRKLEIYHFEEAVANINVGIGERLSDVLTTGSFFFVFSWIHRHFALLDIHPGLWSWIILFLCTDFVWYWYHRVSHEVNIFWAGHIVHHQSEDFNFTVSARITVVQAVARGLFWCVLPFIGFPPAMITVFLLIHGFYPFFTHTQLVGKLGWVEYIFVTPSHHRVHHSSNPEYLDKNYGDVLIIWDKIFGTYADQKEQPVYGLTKPLNSYSFLWQHFHFFLELLVAMRNSDGVVAKFKILLGKPAIIDESIRPALENKLFAHTNHNNRINKTSCSSPSIWAYICCQTLITLAVLFLLVLFIQYIQPLQLFLAALFIVLSVVHTGAMLEQQRWIFQLDIVRLMVAFGWIYTFGPAAWIKWSMLFIVIAIVLGIRTLRDQYNGWFFKSAEI